MHTIHIHHEYMCISFPVRVLSISNDGTTARAESMLDGCMVDINVTFVPEVRVGDYVIVHSGIGVRVVSRDHAMQICSMLVGVDGIDGM